MSKKIPARETCRISGEPLVELFTLGELHISDFIDQDTDPRLEPVELKLMLAPKSGLVQLAHTADFDAMYREYWYRSGTNATMRNELKEIAESAAKLLPPSRCSTTSRTHMHLFQTSKRALMTRVCGLYR